MLNVLRNTVAAYHSLVSHHEVAALRSSSQCYSGYGDLTNIYEKPKDRLTNGKRSVALSRAAEGA